MLNFRGGETERLEMRLDTAVFQRGLTDSREKARRLILGGFVSVGGIVVTKPSFAVAEDAAVTVAANDDFVGRGAYKLLAALDAFSVDLTDRVCLDIGASTGGFCEVMLRRGARIVYAVDVGTGQLAARLAADGRVVNMEQTDARTLTRESFAVPPDFCSVDVSFISLEHIVPPLAARFDCRFVTLVKPQFEAGRADIGKRGVVKSAAAHERVLRAFHAMLGQSGLFLSGLIPSPVRGGDGNAEYLAAFSRETSDFMPDIRAVVRSALA